MGRFREAFLKLLSPAARLLAALGVHLHMITASGICFAFLSAYCFNSHKLLLAVVFFILSGLTDAVDGMVARLRGMASPFGAFLDNFCSAYTDAVVLSGITIGHLCDPVWGFAALLGTTAGVQMTFVLSHKFLEATTPHSKERPFSRIPYVLGGKGDRITLITIGAMLGHLSEAVMALAIVTHSVTACRVLYCWRQEKRTGD